MVLVSDDLVVNVVFCLVDDYYFFMFGFYIDQCDREKQRKWGKRIKEMLTKLW